MYKTRAGRKVHWEDDQWEDYYNANEEDTEGDGKALGRAEKQIKMYCQIREYWYNKT